MAKKKKSAEELEAELNGWGRAYNAAKRRGDQKAMAEAHAQADKIRAEAGWSYNEKTGETIGKTADGKTARVNSQTNVNNAKVWDSKKLKSFAEEKKEAGPQEKKTFVIDTDRVQKQKAQAFQAFSAGKGPVSSTSKTARQDTSLAGRLRSLTDDDKKSLTMQKFLQERQAEAAQRTQEAAALAETRKARASALNQAVLERAKAQGTMPETSMLKRDQVGPISPVPVADVLRNLAEGPLQMGKLTDALHEQRTYKRQMEENLPSAEQALRAAIAGTKGSLGSAYETAKAALGNELGFLADQGKAALTRDLSDLGADYRAQYADTAMDMDSQAAREMRKSARMRELATEDMGTVGKFLTDAGISIAQNVPGMAASLLGGPLGAVAGAAYMGASAAGSKMYEVQENGGNADEALSRGIAAGLIESVTEKFSIDNLLKAAGGSRALRKVLKNMLRQMGVEASEEGASYSLNYLADKLAHDPNATFSVEELMRNMGMGAVSGAAFGGLGSMTGRTDIVDSAREAIKRTQATTAAENALLTQDNAQVNAKYDKSTDPLLLNRLQSPASMADDALAEHSIAQEDAKSNSVSKALRWAMGETLENPKIQQKSVHRAQIDDALAGHRIAQEDVKSNSASKTLRWAMGETLENPKIQQRNAYRAQIDAVFSGQMTKGEKITLGDTPDIVAKYGMQAPLTMTQTTARKIAYPPGYLGGKHNLGIPALKHLPEQLADPIAILKSKTEGDSVVVLTAWNDTQGNPVIIPVHFGKDGTLTVENAIPSAYGKRNLEALFGENGENILYTKNNKSIDQLLSSRLQLPNARADDTLVAYSIAQGTRENNQTGDILRRMTGIENPPETAAEIRAAMQNPETAMQQSMDYIDTWNQQADARNAQAAQAAEATGGETATAQQTAEKPHRMRPSAAGREFYRNFISGQAELEAVARAQKKISPEAVNTEDLMQVSRTAGATVSTIAGERLVDRAGNDIGQSWLDTVGQLSPLESQRLNLYRQHKHNIDRMSQKARAAETLRQARAELTAFRRQHPNLAGMTEAELRETARAREGQGQSELAQDLLTLIEQERTLAAIEDKPVLGKKVTGKDGNDRIVPYTAEESREIVRQMEQEHPELKTQAQVAEKFHEKFMYEWAVGSGLMSEEQFRALQERYPGYVQTYRVRDSWGNAKPTYRGTPDSGSPIRQAVGDVSEIVPFEDAEMMQVNRIVKAARRNELFQNLYSFAKTHPKQAAPFIRIRGEGSAQNAGDYDSLLESTEQSAMRQDGGVYTLTVMIDGKPIRMEVNAEIYAGLQNLYGQDRGASDAFGAKVSKWLTNPFKQLTTGRNPLFFLSNFPKDFQTAYINTQSGRKWIVGYLKDVGSTIRSMAQNSDEWKTFQALGGKDSGFYHNEKGFRESAKGAKKARSKAGKAAHAVGDFFDMISENTEALWRFNEYRAAIRKYGDTQEGRAKAIQAAADVTTNFSRTAPMAKAAENYCAYLNASLQGLDKMARQLKNHPFLTTRRAAEIIAVPTLLLYMLNHDDEDYQNLNDRTKDNYYCIPNPAKEGTFIKIPKSREYGVAMGALWERFLRLADGEDAESAFDGIGGQFLTNIAPSNPFTDNIAKTLFIDLPNNRDFAGRSIVPERLKSLSPENQYDYSTSGAGIALSKAWNATGGKILPQVSPMQVDYLIDSNLGFVGDIILGSSQRGNRSVADVLRSVITEPVIRKLTADPMYQNGVTDAFYRELEQAETTANDKNLTEGLEARAVTPEEKYLSALKAASTEISQLRQQEREILSDLSIDAREQEEQVREIRREINQIAKAAPGKAAAERDAWAKNYVMEISHMTDEKQAHARAAHQEGGTPYADFVRYDDRYNLLKKDKEAGAAADRAQLASYLEADEGLNQEQKEGIYEHLLIQTLGDSRKEDWENTYKGRITPSLFFEIANEYSEINDNLDNVESGKAQAKATAFSMYLDGLGLSDELREQVENDFKYFNQNPAKPQNYTFDMLRERGGKNEKAYATAMEKSGITVEDYDTIKAMKNAKDADGSYTYKKDDIVQAMREKGWTSAQINAVCGAFGWKPPASSSKKKSSGSKKSSSSGGSSTGKTLRRLTGLPTLPALGR